LITLLNTTRWGVIPLKSAQNSSNTNNKSHVEVMPKPSNSALNGALTGIMIGARFGPQGAIVGSIIGGVVGFIVDEVND
jgi:hypothetical protein